MRIVGYIEHPRMKITLFKTDTRYSVKLEAGFLEQTYKFLRPRATDELSEIRKLIDEDFLQEVERQFRQMGELHAGTLAKHFSQDEEDEFDELI